MSKLHTSGEDYLETILILRKKYGTVRSSDIADFMKVTRPSVCRAVGKLKDGGFLVMNDDKTLTLTKAGVSAAKRVYEKHCILKNVLISLGVNPETAEQDACAIEHVISRESFEKIKELKL